MDCAAIEVDQLPGGQVAAVALHAHAALGLAGQHGADLDPLDAGGLDFRCQVFGDFLVDAYDRLTRERILYVLERHASDDTVAERLDDLPALDDRGDVDPVERVAVDQRDDDILGDVDQPAGQVSGVRRLQRRVGQPFSGAVSRDEVLKHSQPLAEVGCDRGFHDLARRLGH